MRIIYSLLFVFIVAASCTSTKKTTDVYKAQKGGMVYADSVRDGSSAERAIVIKAKDEIAGVAAEYDWLRAKYPGHTLVQQSANTMGQKKYDVMVIKTKQGEEKTFYFDITDFYGKGIGF